MATNDGPSDERYFGYWGKADPTVEGGLHLAAFHSIDVACVAEAILRSSAVLRAKFARALETDDARVVPTVTALCAVHDVGKFDARFQSKAPEAVERLGRASTWGTINGTGFDHGSAGYREFCAWESNAPSEWRALWGSDGVMALLAAVCGHHGFVPTGNEAQRDLRMKSWREQDRDAQRSFVREVLALYREDGAAFPLNVAPSASTQWLLAGLCSVADWIGSQTEFEGEPLFVYEQAPCPLRGYRERSRARAKRAVDELRLGQSAARARSFGELFHSDEGVAFAPRDVQVATESITACQRPSLVIVEAAMGSGKTEAALSLASRWIGAGLASGVYVALPTMATANGIAGRVERAAAVMFAEDERVQFRLAHSRARQDELFKKLVQRAHRGRATLDERADGDETEAEVLCARWFLSAKRALLAQVGVGTVDQAMLSVLRAKHSFVRLFGLASSVVIVDELHAYDSYMEVILERLVEWLASVRTPVVLLSATLPSTRKRLFVDAYQRGMGSDGSKSAIPPLSDAYPLVTVASADGVEQIAARPTERRTIAIETGPWVEDQDGAVDEHDTEVENLVRAAKSGEMCVWIRNTVNDARAAYRAVIECAQREGLPLDRVKLFHSRFRPSERKSIEGWTLSTFGKAGRQRRTGAVLIATQVVEQSLDLDFDRMVSDLAPIDLLLQRAGRLWRWALSDDAPSRPSSAREVLRVLVPRDEKLHALSFGGTGYVYDPATLWLTAEALARSPSVEIPAMLRALIEECYAPEQRSERIRAASNRATLEASEARLERALSELRARAERSALPEALAEPRSGQGFERDDEKSTEALTRVGRSETFLPVWWDHDEGVAKTLDGVVLPSSFDSRARDSWKQLELLLEQLVRIPAYDWDPLIDVGSAKGEAGPWDEWRARCASFLSEMKQRAVNLLPMHKRGEQYRCRVEYRSQYRSAFYSLSEGFWLQEEGR
ncbi:MAG: CRISPR-associated helicase Cas3' [Polyangiales bacterium]